MEKLCDVRLVGSSKQSGRFLRLVRNDAAEDEILICVCVGHLSGRDPSRRTPRQQHHTPAHMMTATKTHFPGFEWLTKFRGDIKIREALRND